MVVYHVSSQLAYFERQWLRTLVCLRDIEVTCLSPVDDLSNVIQICIFHFTAKVTRPFLNGGVIFAARLKSRYLSSGTIILLIHNLDWFFCLAEAK